MEIRILHLHFVNISDNIQMSFGTSVKLLLAFDSTVIPSFTITVTL
jgi:hypothetical protein